MLNALADLTHTKQTSKMIFFIKKKNILKMDKNYTDRVEHYGWVTHIGSNQDFILPLIKLKMSNENLN